MAKTIGIDLGTAYTRFCLPGEGIVLRAPSVVSIENRTGAVLAVGAEARQMIGRTPANISAIKPIRGGAIANKDHATLLVSSILDAGNFASTFRRPAILAAIPYGASESERRSVEDVMFDAGASTVYLAEQPMAAAIGAGMKVMNPRGGMLVDIGAGTVEVAVISHGGIIISTALKTAGEAMTDAVIRAIIENHSVLVGERTAESIKIKLATLSQADRGSAPVYGKSTKMGGIACAEVSSGELREALRPYAATIVRAIRGALEAMPPELSSDISDYGIVLCGGGSLLPGLPEYIKNALGMNVTRAKDPLDCVALGLHQILAGGPKMKRFICSKSK